MADLRLEMSFQGIGPHANSVFDERMHSINMAIYANNGSGKSFISKSFKRVTDFYSLDKTDDNKTAELISKSNAMIRFGEKQGNMRMCITADGNTKKELKATFGADKLPIVDDDTGLILHVFNSEYVKENLESVRYKPEDKVSGFILGKVNIDLSKEKEQLKDLVEEKKRKTETINEEIKKAQNELKSKGVQSNTKEFTRLSFDLIKSNVLTSEIRAYDSILEKYNALKSMPDNIPDIVCPPSPAVGNITEKIEEIDKLLKTEFSLSNLAESFKSEVREKQSFIETGTSLSNGEKCPFCGQKYSQEALDLIDDYNKFLSDVEAKTIKKIGVLTTWLQECLNNLAAFISKNEGTKSKFNEVKNYFPSFDDVNLEEFEVDTLDCAVQSIVAKLADKKKDISSGSYDISQEQKIVARFVKYFNETLKSNKRKIDLLNNNKNNISTERLTLRKSLCNAKFNELVNSLKDRFAELDALLLKEQSLTKEIEEKEGQAKIDKRKTLISELKRYLGIFFKDKYEFDEEKFCIKFQDKVLINDTDNVMSDGEKSILAFCFYLANIHGIVSKDADYNRLLLIIDDPVSSMDFNYVYNVAQVIRNIKKNEKITKVRFIVLTHNMEFMSILVRNNVAQQKYIFSNGKFDNFKDQYIMPYMANLKDIYQAAQMSIKPSHTLPNSIRHILETIYRFEGSVGKFDDYLLNDEILKECGFLYSLIEDQSHGGLREERGYTDEMLIETCKTVVEFISNKYPGQIEEIKKLIA